ncbi:hypothetical protein GCM10009716_13470 [Streptomyces sodiiphilus]|uniref:Uncharacterized protein n=1 Tax=Streptomyces sodiiphilus TaxID=226217 RepID=A0ABP5A6I3_9ACTN
MPKTAADYTWFSKEFPLLAEAYCFTLVRDVSPDDLINRLGGRREGTTDDITAFVDHSYGPTLDGDFGAMAALGPWTLLIEPNGYLGVNEERAMPASAGTCWVSHFVNVNRVGAFLWAEDEEARLRFDPMFPNHRWGSTPDALLETMRHIGFHLGDEKPENCLSRQAAFALAGHLTGVSLSARLLMETTYTLASLPHSQPGRV